MMCLDSITIHCVIQILIATLSSYGEFVRDRTGQGTVSLSGHNNPEHEQREEHVPH